MITHNGKYLGAATHHGMPIYAATMGGKMVIGYGLLSATLQAIVAAFGAEGTEVIRKTNDYLNQIATTDPQRALLLAGFINEDPMLVCSLVETSKTRWLVGDGKAYMDTGFICDVNTIVDIKFQVNQVHSSRIDIFGTFISTSDGLCIWSEGINKSVNVNAPSINYTNYILVVGDAIDVHIEGRQAIVNGNINNLAGKFSNSTYPAYLYTMNTRGATTGNLIKASVAKLALSKPSEVREMYPFIRNGENGMLDIISGTFYPNANTQGSFTIALTDKTTS